MEPSQSLAIESFSYSWLSNVEPCLDDDLQEPCTTSRDNSSESTSKVELKRLLDEIQDFNFDVPISHSPALSMHADELFSNGVINPIFVNSSKMEICNQSDNILVMPVSLSRSEIPKIQSDCHFFRRWRNSSARILHKCFRCLKPLCYRVRGSRKSTRVNDIDRREFEVKSWSNSPQASPERCTVYSTGDFYDIDNSIHEAVLHCKRSIEK